MTDDRRQKTEARGFRLRNGSNTDFGLWNGSNADFGLRNAELIILDFSLRRAQPSRIQILELIGPSLNWAFTCAKHLSAIQIPKSKIKMTPILQYEDIFS